MGCFHVRGFLSHLRQVPDHPITLQTALWICTRRNPNPINPAKQLISYDMNSLEGSVFDPGLPTKIIVHGYGGQFKSPTIIAAKNAILQAVRFCHTNLLLFLRRQCCAVYIWWRHRIYYTFILQPLLNTLWKLVDTQKRWRIGRCQALHRRRSAKKRAYRYIDIYVVVPLDTRCQFLAIPVMLIQAMGWTVRRSNPWREKHFSFQKIPGHLLICSLSYSMGAGVLSTEVTQPRYEVTSQPLFSLVCGIFKIS